MKKLISFLKAMVEAFKRWKTKDSLDQVVDVKKMSANEDKMKKAWKGKKQKWD